MNTPENKSLKMWQTPVIVEINIDQIKQEVSQMDAALINLLTNDETSFRLLTGSL